MKKLLALLLAAAMCFSLVACGGKVEDAVIGDWTGDFVYGSTTIHANGNSDMCLEAGHKATTTLSIYNGGAMQFVVRSNETGFETKNSGTWEVSDGVLVITYSNWGGDKVLSFVVDADSTPNTLTIQGSNVYFPDTLVKDTLAKNK